MADSSALQRGEILKMTRQAFNQACKEAGLEPTEERIYISNDPVMGLRLHLESKSVFLDWPVPTSPDEIKDRYIDPLVKAYVYSLKAATVVAKAADYIAVPNVIEQRGTTHGSFNDNANLATAQRAWLRSTPNWNKLVPEQQLALDEIVLKMARMLSGGAPVDFKDHWDDIAGYATLGSQACDRVGKAAAPPTTEG